MINFLSLIWLFIESLMIEQLFIILYSQTLMDKMPSGYVKQDWQQTF